MVSTADVRSTIKDVLRALAQRGYHDAESHLTIRLFLFEQLRRRGQPKRPPLVSAVRYGMGQFAAFLPNVMRLRRSGQMRLVVVPASHRVWRRSQEPGVSKHADSVARMWVRESDRVLLLETGLGPASFRSPDDVPVINISLVVWVLQRIAAVFTRRQRTLALAVVDILDQFDARPTGVSRRQFARRIERHLSRAQWLRRIYGDFLRFDQCSQLVTVVYYTLDAMAITAAAQRSGCATAEYQHGVQNDHHPMYALDDMPVDLGVATSLPREFRVWDDIAYHRAMRWMALFPDAGFRAQVTGNLWLACLTDGGDGVSGDTDTTRILVALQEWPVTFNMALIPALSCLDGEIEVIVRPHPRDGVRIETIRRVFAATSFAGALVVQRPEEEPVEACLARSSLCITGFSTVGIEALQLGMTCLFTHPNARDGLADYIDGRRCHYADTEAGIRTVLQRWQEATLGGRRARLQA
ncbi:MAG: hypothetical protein CMP06_09665 [Xanthomonadales bacterium]|nr:hypothetical protein [Xanthomonadales bacterium]